MSKSSAERGAGVARQGAARARCHAEMLAGDRRAEARLGRRREPLQPRVAAAGGEGEGGEGEGGAGGGLSGAGPRPSRWAAGRGTPQETHGRLTRSPPLDHNCSFLLFIARFFYRPSLQ